MLPNHALRMVPDSDDTFEGWAVNFDGGLVGGKDLYNTRFSEATRYHLDWFDVRPLLYHHGQDDAVRTDTIGKVLSLEMRSAGVWMKGQLDKGSEFYTDLKEMVKREALAVSSGTLNYLMKLDQRSGDMLEWPIVEVSLTPTPGGLNNRIDVSTVRSAYRSAGIGDDAAAKLDAIIALYGDGEDVEVIRAVWTTAYMDSLPNSSFAYVEPNAGTDKSKRHLPYKDKDGMVDEAHLRDALSRVDQTKIPAAAKDSARKKLEAAAKSAGITVSSGSSSSTSTSRAAEGDTVPDDGATRVAATVPGETSYEEIREQLCGALNPDTPFASDTYWSVCQTYADHAIAACYDYDGDDPTTYWDIPYTLGDDGITLGDPAQVEKTWSPVARSSDVPLTLDAQLLARSASALGQRTKDLTARRTDEKRPLSRSNRSALDAVVTALTGTATELVTMCARDADLTAAQAEAAAVADPAARRIAIELLELELALSPTQE